MPLRCPYGHFVVVERAAANDGRPVRARHAVCPVRAVRHGLVVVLPVDDGGGARETAPRRGGGVVWRRGREADDLEAVVHRRDKEIVLARLGRVPFYAPCAAADLDLGEGRRDFACVE